MMVMVFSMREARSAGFLLVVGLALLLETSVLHVVLAKSHPLIAWALTLSSLSLLVWLALDHRALGSTTVEVGPGFIEGTIGRRLTFSVRAADVKSVGRPALLSVNGPPKGYVNATKPAAPNVLIVFRRPTPVTLFGRSRSITQLALRIDGADEFINEWAVCANQSAMPGDTE